MTTQELTTRIASLAPQDLLAEAKQWFGSPESLPDFGAWLADYVKDIDNVGSNDSLPALRVALFCLARQRKQEALADLCALLENKNFVEKIQNNDWIIANMHRILGSIAKKEDLSTLEKLPLNSKLSEDLREQALLAIHFMWIETILDAASVTEVYRRLINTYLASGELKERMAMALALNGAVVGGAALRSEVAAIIDSGVLGDQTATITQAVQTIITQTQRFREIYARQHKGFFDKPEDELLTIHEPVIEDLPEMPGKVKPITRSQPKVGRNDPCPCGSGKKYKKCCGKNA